MTATQTQKATLPIVSHRRVIAAACLFGAEIIHIDVIDEHVREWLFAGLFFLVIAVLEGVLGVALLVGSSPRRVRLTIWVSALTAAVWLVSRTVGLGIGPMPWVPEEVGWPDSIATFLELMTIALLVVPTSTAVAARRLHERRLGTAMTVAAVAAMTLVAVLPIAETTEHVPHLNPTCGITVGPPCPPDR